MGEKINKRLNFFYVNFFFLSLNFEIILIFSKLKEITKKDVFWDQIELPLPK